MAEQNVEDELAAMRGELPSAERQALPESGSGDSDIEAELAALRGGKNDA